MPLPLLAVVALFAGTTVLSALLQARQKVPNQKPGEFNDVTSSQGRKVKVFAGTVKDDSPNLGWWGDKRAVPIRKKGGGFFGIGGKRITVAFEYYVGAQFVECFGPAALRGLFIDDKYIWRGAAGDGAQIIVNRPNQFGGKDQGGGLFMNLIWRGGHGGDNTPNPYLAARNGGNYPSHKDYAHLISIGPSGAGRNSKRNPLRQSGYVGNAPQLPKLALEVERLPNLSGAWLA